MPSRIILMLSTGKKKHAMYRYPVISSQPIHTNAIRNPIHKESRPADSMLEGLL
jgi:hypothetical protein